MRRGGFFGGSLEEGETPEQALVREIREELCYELPSYEFIGHFDFQVLPDYRLEEWVYVSPMPPLEQLSLQEGAGMKLFTFAEAGKAVLPQERDVVLVAIERFLRNR